jgi:hypothetical protein
MMSSPPPSILASWLTNYYPLPKGEWDGQYWSDAQTARASNDTQLQAPIAPMNAIRFVVTNGPGGDFNNEVRFDVVIDLPGPDQTAWRDLQNNSVVALEPMLASLGITLDYANERGFYISEVRDAYNIFTVTAEATSQ